MSYRKTSLYSRIDSIEAIKTEKRLLKKYIRHHERILADDWEDVKKTFQFLNIAVSLTGFFFSGKKGKWMPVIFTASQFAFSALKKLKNA
ncbi:MAG: hypothetical protein LBD45_07525 [Bacteroidales bacterium]|jgi:hypothetical protein|nr:hypothetical protein [Bacteroidales bacterium]